MKIFNGWGDGGWGWRINNEGQASTLAETQTEARHLSENEGVVYILSSGFAVSSNVANTFTNIFYIKNTSTTHNLYIGYLRTCNEIPGKWQYTDNPTALGTTSVTAINMKRGADTPLVADVQSFSAAGTTFSDGTTADFPQWIQGGPGHSIQPFEGALILGANQAFGLSFAPFNTTAGDVCITMQAWQIPK